MCWYSAKELSYQVRGEGADDDRGSNLRRQLVQLFVQHAMQHDAMGELLNSPLDKEVRCRRPPRTARCVPGVSLGASCTYPCIAIM